MDQKKVKEVLERAMARIGCPPGDNADADLYGELQAILASLRDQGAEPVVELPTHDEAMKWLTDQDIFVSAGSRTATIHSAPTVLLQFAEHVLSTSAAASPQPTPDLARLIEAGRKLKLIAIKELAELEVGDPEFSGPVYGDPERAKVINADVDEWDAEVAKLSSAPPVGAEKVFDAGCEAEDGTIIKHPSNVTCEVCGNWYEDGAPSVPEPRTEQGPTDVDELAKALNSISDAMATWVGDWAADKTLAWIFGVVLGWEDALPEVLKKHRWSEADGQRLQRLHAAVESAKTALAPKDYTKQEVDADALDTVIARLNKAMDVWEQASDRLTSLFEGKGE